MENLENLKNLAREAAVSHFLWELGIRVPSANQARKVCQILGLNLADEKRVKAVLRMREENPDILLEICGEAANEGEKEMVEVIAGPKHYEREAEIKDSELWEKIARDCNIHTAGSQNPAAYPFMRFSTNEEQLRYPNSDYLSFPVTIHFESSRYMIKILPVRYYPLNFAKGVETLLRNINEIRVESFFVDVRAFGATGKEDRVYNGRYWNTPHLVVKCTTVDKLTVWLCHILTIKI